MPRLLALGILALGGATGAARAGVIPLPAEIDLRDGQFALDAGTRIVAPAGDREALFAAQYLVDLLARSSGLALQVQRVASMQSAGSAQQSAADPTVVFEREPGMAAEGYRIVVGPQRVEIAASTGAGLMYGAVTLWELLPPGAGGGAVPAQIIHDQPAYAWRGLLLDSVRHFQSPDFIKSMLDWMAWHKLNVLHWHLTDDQGWRLQIKRYPRLTSVGAWRIPAAVTSGLLTLDDANYGGFYTQSDVRSIVAYAAERHIDIVPEIEMPGHAQAAIAAYPQLGSTDGATPPTPAPPVSARWGVHNYLFNLEPDTFRFFENVLTEVMQLFPSHYIHIGGDEAVKDQWLASPAVQARAQKLGISDPEDLQGYFTQTIGAFIAKHGRRMVGWDEIMRPGLDAGAVVMSWRGAAGAHAAALAGNDTVLAPWPALYFDNRQSTLPSEPPGRIKVISLQDVYNFDPYDKTLTPEQRAHLLGVQANLWTEHIQTEERVQLMALPRAAAVAEVGWTPAASRNWNDFLTRLGSQFERYQALGVVYSDSVFAVASRVRRTDAATEVTLSNQGQFGAIRFTTDGHDPTAQSATYAAPLALPLGTELRAATFLGERRLSGVLTRRLDRDSLARRTSHELQLCSDGVALILEPSFALDIENPCWIRRGVDLSNGPAFAVSVGPLPFNYEIGAEVKKIVVGDARTANGEFEIRVDGCDQPAAVTVPLPAPGTVNVTTRLQGVLPTRPGRHDLCLRFSRPRLDPMWGLDWVEIRE